MYAMCPNFVYQLQLTCNSLSPPPQLLPTKLMSCGLFFLANIIPISIIFEIVPSAELMPASSSHL